MTLEEQVKKSILNYPSLFKFPTYERSRLSVLDQLFLTIGNGYEWAKTKDPSKGGYLTDEPKYYSRGDKEGERKFDPPYGKEKSDRDFSPNYFNNKVFYIGLPNYKVKIENVYFRKREYGDDDILIEFSGISEDSSEQDPLKKFLGRGKNEPYLMQADRGLYEEDDRGFSPYPICEYSAIREIYDQNLFVQPDWLQGAIDVAKATLEYFSDESRYSNDSYYPSEDRIKQDEKFFEERFKDGGQKVVDELRKIWGYKEGQTVREAKEESWAKFHQESVTFLNNFLSRYDKP